MAESEKKTVEALWVGPYEAQLPDGTILTPGETTHQITAGEALSSDNWQAVNKSDVEKAEIEAQLVEQNIDYDPSASKAKLLKLLETSEPQPPEPEVEDTNAPEGDQ